jgi:hypothetical protein
VNVGKRRLSLEVLVALEHHIDGLQAEAFTVFQSAELTSHLGGRHHLHGLGDLLNGLD